MLEGIFIQLAIKYNMKIEFFILVRICILVRFHGRFASLFSLFTFEESLLLNALLVGVFRTSLVYLF